MNRKAVPEDGIYRKAKCDDCEINEAEFARGNGVYYKEICGHCRVLEVMARPMTLRGLGND